MVAITSFRREDIFHAVKKMYTDVAEKPEIGFHFPTGRWICEVLGYPKPQLDAVPETALESFAGVGYPFRCNLIQNGDVILDIGVGAGTDSLIATLLTGEDGTVYGLDMTPAMHEKLRDNAVKMGATNIEPLFGNAEEIPLQDSSVDVVTSNGVLNLVPDKEKISDIIIHKNADALASSKTNPELWAECVAGAVDENDYLGWFQDAGIGDLKIHCHQDYFSNSDNESTRKIAAFFQAESITLSGAKK